MFLSILEEIHRKSLFLSAMFCLCWLFSLHQIPCMDVIFVFGNILQECQHFLEKKKRKIKKEKKRKKKKNNKNKAFKNQKQKNENLKWKKGSRKIKRKKPYNEPSIRFPYLKKWLGNFYRSFAKPKLLNNANSGRWAPVRSSQMGWTKWSCACRTKSSRNITFVA